ncbi:MAG: ATP-binding protein [Actinomycetota bacterium]
MIALAVVPALILGALGVGLVILLSRQSESSPLTSADFSNAAVALGLMTVGILGAAGVLAYWSAYRAAERTAAPLRALRAQTDRLTELELPTLVDTLHSTDGSGEIPAVRTLDVHAEGEVAELADSLSRLRATTIDTVASQAIGRSQDLAGVLVNLGRRNQQLIGRQLQLIDQLEATESDPDMLRSLFALDQLATRMRRNAESLLVLAGERVDRQLQTPQPVDEVLRAATSEVEDYHRVTHDGVEPATVSPRAASDLTHLLAELIENATGFSDSDSPVRLMGRWDERGGGYTISVVDEGPGMSRRELAESNDRIATSSVGAESPTSYLGLFVVGRLASRHDIDARLVEAAPSGTIAKVTLPPRIVSERSSTGQEPVVGEGRLAGTRPPAVESALAPITGPVPRITVDGDATPVQAPAPERPVRSPLAPPTEPAAEVELPAAEDEDLTAVGDDAAPAPIPPFRRRSSQLPGGEDDPAGEPVELEIEPEPAVPGLHPDEAAARSAIEVAATVTADVAAMEAAGAAEGDETTAATTAGVDPDLAALAPPTVDADLAALAPPSVDADLAALAPPSVDAVPVEAASGEAADAPIVEVADGEVDGVAGEVTAGEVADDEVDALAGEVTAGEVADGEVEVDVHEVDAGEVADGEVDALAGEVADGEVADGEVEVDVPEVDAVAVEVDVREADAAAVEVNAADDVAAADVPPAEAEAVVGDAPEASAVEAERDEPDVAAEAETDRGRSGEGDTDVAGEPAAEVEVADEAVEAAEVSLVEVEEGAGADEQMAAVADDPTDGPDDGVVTDIDTPERIYLDETSLLPPRHPSDPEFRDPGPLLEIVPEPDGADEMHATDEPSSGADAPAPAAIVTGTADAEPQPDEPIPAEGAADVEFDHAEAVREQLASFNRGVTTALASATAPLPADADEAADADPRPDETQEAEAEEEQTEAAPTETFAVAVGGAGLPVEDE